MNTIKNLLFILTVGALAASCSKASYRKTPGGMPYQLFKSGDTQQVKVGNFIKLSFAQKINDSVYFTTEGKMPIYIPVLAQTTSYDISEIWAKLHLGDSVATTQMMDTFIKRMPPGSIPPQFKKGDRILTYAKVLGIFTSDSAQVADKMKEEKNFQAAEVASIQKYLNDKKITTQRTKSGAFVEIINPGNGNLADSGKYVSVNYTGTTFDGKKFDSNTDSAFNHVQPYSFTVGIGEMIKGFDEAVSLLRPGGSAKVYIPSMLAYGERPPQGSPIRPYEKLIFEIAIVDLKDKAPAQPPMHTQPQPQKVDAPQPNK